MRQPIKRQVACLLALAALLLPCDLSAQVLTLGTISDRPTAMAERFMPFAKYLERQLKGSEITSVEVLIPTGVVDAARAMAAGKLDLFIDSSMMTEVLRLEVGGKYVARRWKKGRDKYRSVVFVRQDSPAQSLADLKGHMLAFEDVYSTSGYLLPLASIKSQQLKVQPYPERQDGVRTDEIGSVTAGDNETQIAWVERKFVTAAAMSEKDYKDLAKSALAPLRVLHATSYVPYHVVMARNGLADGLVHRIKVALLASDKNEEGRKVLRKFKKTTRFDEIPQDLRQNLMALSPFLSRAQ